MQCQSPVVPLTSYVHTDIDFIYLNISPFPCISATGDSLMHPQGTHMHEFSFQLPQALPSSFEGAHGYVRYWAKATMDRPWKFDHDTKTAFTVISHLDLNDYADQLRVSFPLL